MRFPLPAHPAGGRCAAGHGPWERIDGAVGQRAGRPVWFRPGARRPAPGGARSARTAVRSRTSLTHRQPGRAYVASIDLDKVLDKAWADRALPEILQAPVSALKGVSDRDGELLDQAFGVKTVADLAGLKYVRWAQALAALDTTAK